MINEQEQFYLFLYRLLAPNGFKLKIGERMVS